jgi:2-dehydro-3-deoxyphosphogalactonate aldolase
LSALLERLGCLPLVAILRGIRPEEAAEVGSVLVDLGIPVIEVPLNSPDPFASIEVLAQRFGEDVLIGAGTVLRDLDVATVRDAGGQLIVMPHACPAVVSAAKAMGLLALPGFATPTEAFAMISAGADGLKLFPAEASSPVVLKSMKAVLPPSVPVLAVGGISEESLGPWLRAGVAGFGVGSALYRAGDCAQVVRRRGASLVAAFRAVMSGDGPQGHE